jgi:hypothetical protein
MAGSPNSVCLVGIRKKNKIKLVKKIGQHLVNISCKFVSFLPVLYNPRGHNSLPTSRVFFKSAKRTRLRLDSVTQASKNQTENKKKEKNLNSSWMEKSLLPFTSIVSLYPPPPRESQNWHSGKDRRVKSGERKKNHSKKAYPTCKSHVIRSAIATPLGMSR